MEDFVFFTHMSAEVKRKYHHACGCIYNSAADSVIIDF